MIGRMNNNAMMPSLNSFSGLLNLLTILADPAGMKANIAALADASAKANSAISAATTANAALDARQMTFQKRLNHAQTASDREIAIAQTTFDEACAARKAELSKREAAVTQREALVGEREAATALLQADLEKRLALLKQAAA